MSKKNKNRNALRSPMQAQHTRKVAIAEKSSRALDGFANMASRLGVSNNVDNQLSQGFYEFNNLTYNRVELEAAYRGSWIVGAAVDSRAEDMTRAGVDITSNEAAQNIDEIQNALTRLQIFKSLQDGLKWGFLYGGAIGVIVIAGQALDTPLDISTIGKSQFRGVSIYDRWQVNPDLQNTIKSGPQMGLPAYYQLVSGISYDPDALAEPKQAQALHAQGGIRVHHSRVIRFDGIKLPYWQAITNMGWGMSLIERIFDRLISFDTATLSAANLVNYAHLRRVGVKDLREVLAAGGSAEEAMIKSFEYMRMFQNNEGITLTDQEDEYNSNSYTFAGLSDVMLQFGQQLAGGIETPLVRLFGQSPAGLNSTGESDLRMYYDNINSKQERDLREPVQTVLEILYRSLFEQDLPRDLNFKFSPLWQMSASDKATNARNIVETIIKAYTDGAIDLATCLRELRQTSKDTGLFTNITDEMIELADNDVPPEADFDIGTGNVSLTPDGLEVNDGLFAKIKKLFKGKAA